MGLKERFKQWLDTKPREQIREVQLQVISDDYAIDFAEWFNRFVQYYDNVNGIRYYTFLHDLEVYTSLQLLEIFKKEKGYGV